MDEKELDQKIEALARASESARIQMDTYADVVKLMGLSGVAAKKKIIELAGGVDKLSKRLKVSASEIEAAIKDLRTSFASGESSADDLTDELTTLRDQINKTSDQNKKQALLDAKADLEAMNARAQANKALKDGAGSFVGALTLGTAKLWASGAAKALSGADAFEIAGSMMTGGVDLINTANQGGANALKTFGEATAGAGGRVGTLGAIAAVTGEALGAVSEGMSNLAKAGIGFMLAQTKQLIAGFQSMSSVGAVYNGGMMAMVKTSLTAGMTLEQFSKAVSANSANLARTGLGVGEASKRMAAAMQKGGEAARNGMFALGMGMEDQADAYAVTMASMAGPSGKLKSSNAEVAEQTQEYAKNLKIISTLTGEDIKAKQEKIRQELDTLFMKQKLDEMEPKQRAKFTDMLKTMNDDQRRQLTERMKYNGVISKDLGAAEALSSGFRSAGDKFYRAWKDGSASGEVGRKIQADSAEQMKKDAKEQSSISIANSETAVSISKVLASNWTTSASMTKEGLAAAEEAANAQINAGKRGTDTGANDLEMLQNNMIEMQGLAVKHMDKFQRALDLSYKAAMSAVKAFDSLATSAANNPIKSGITALLPAIVGMIGPLLLTKFFGGKFGVLGASAANPMHVTGDGFGGKGNKFKDLAKKGTTAATAGAAGFAAANIGAGLVGATLATTESVKATQAAKKGDADASIEANRRSAQYFKGGMGEFADPLIEAENAKAETITQLTEFAKQGNKEAINRLDKMGVQWRDDLAKQAVSAKKSEYMKTQGLKWDPVAGTYTKPGSGFLGFGKKQATPEQLKAAHAYATGDTSKADIKPNETKLAMPATNPWGAAYPTKPIAGAVLGATLTKDNAANKKIAAVGPELSKKEMYEVNGQPVDKATYDKYLKDNPQLANMMNRANSLNQSTAPKPLASQTSQNLAAEQTKLYGAVVDPVAAKKAAMEKPVASASPGEQQQINILQTILATLQKNNHISSGILQNSY